ncbi:hypothetical protein [Stappia sp.]|uniref:hypothetical protein n=1 Tax=Stappia sp. TaxID=1870903 RepID=UPI003A991920
MGSLATRFFATGAFFALLGMVWGIQMSATNDHTMGPVHGHLNLIGFVSMSIFGGFYALSPGIAALPIARVHYWLSVLAVVVLVPGIYMALSGTGEVLAQAGSLLSVLTMALFLFIVLRSGRRGTD